MMTSEEIVSWPASNFENPESRGRIVVDMAAPSLALVIISASLRFYGRGVLRHALGKDDWMMFAAVVRIDSCLCFDLASAVGYK
jgi:hypothetical protein